MINLFKKEKSNVGKANQKEAPIQYSVVKYYKETLGYNQLRNHVKQEYYDKVLGCSVKNTRLVY